MGVKVREKPVWYGINRISTAYKSDIPYNALFTPKNSNIAPK